MAASSAVDITDNDSDYGSDISADGQWMLTDIPMQSATEILTTTQDNGLRLKDLEDNEGPAGVRVPYRLAVQSEILSLSQPAIEIAIEIPDEQGDGPKTFDVKSNRSTGDESTSAIDRPLEPVAADEPPDLRSPLERFRTKPHKALSVTDLVSPSWCELQYWYVLTKHGKKRRTPAMKQGSAIHKTLEEQVHVTVAVTLDTKEDRWGLRIWNVIQGLRTLRETGLTRELEVWGLVDGLLVNGIIDELSYECPDPGLETRLAAQTDSKKKALPADQRTLLDFLSPTGSLESNGQGILNKAAPSASTPPADSPKVYLTDIKTRSVKSLPSGSSFRPTSLQLMLYHRFLASLIEGSFDPSTLYERYDIDPSKTFSDSFIAQVGALNAHTTEASQDTMATASQDTTTTLLEHNSLSSLWTYLLHSLRKTFPAGQASLSRVLNASYRSAITGDLLGNKSFAYDDAALEAYLSDGMRWWKGQREARGVDVQEAFKCGRCEFGEGCEWRLNKVEEERVARGARSVV